LFRKKKPVYFLDENVKMSISDIERLDDCVIINSTDKFPKGTSDERLTKASLKNNWVVVTKDIRMALRSLQDNVHVIYISDEYKTVSYLNVDIYGRKKYPNMFDYLYKRFGFNK